MRNAPTAWIRNDGRSDRPLDTLAVGRGSSLEFELAGLPEGVENVTVHVGRPGTDSRAAARATALPDGRGGVYLSGLYFPTAGRTHWHVTAQDKRGGNRWFGRGVLDVVQTTLGDAPSGTPPIVPDDTYVRNPVTGLWHRLTVDVEDGQLVPTIESEGVER